MQTDSLKQFVALRGALEQERARIETRLKAIAAALAGTSLSVAPALVAKPTPLAKPTPPPPTQGKPKLSAAGKARIIAAQNKRWAKIRAAKAAAAKPAPAAKPSPKPSMGGKANQPAKPAPPAKEKK